MTPATKWTVKSTKVGSNRGVVRILLPMAISRPLPEASVWEVTVVPDGLHFKYVGETDPETRPKRSESTHLPFVGGKHA